MRQLDVFVPLVVVGNHRVGGLDLTGGVYLAVVVSSVHLYGVEFPEPGEVRFVDDHQGDAGDVHGDLFGQFPGAVRHCLSQARHDRDGQVLVELPELGFIDFHDLRFCLLPAADGAFIFRRVRVEQIVHCRLRGGGHVE